MSPRYIVVLNSEVEYADTTYEAAKGHAETVAKDSGPCAIYQLVADATLSVVLTSPVSPGGASR